MGSQDYTIYYYDEGDEKVSVTGGWISAPGYVIGPGSQSKEVDHMRNYVSGSTPNYRGYGTANAIDLTNISTLKIEWASTTGPEWARCIVTESLDTKTKELDIGRAGNFSRSVNSIDVSGISGVHHIVVSANVGTGWSRSAENLTYKVWGEGTLPDPVEDPNTAIEDTEENRDEQWLRIYIHDIDNEERTVDIIQREPITAETFMSLLRSPFGYEHTYSIHDAVWDDGWGYTGPPKNPNHIIEVCPFPVEPHTYPVDTTGDVLVVTAADGVTQAVYRLFPARYNISVSSNDFQLGMAGVGGTHIAGDIVDIQALPIMGQFVSWFGIGNLDIIEKEETEPEHDITEILSFLDVLWNWRNMDEMSFSFRVGHSHEMIAAIFAEGSVLQVEAYPDGTGYVDPQGRQYVAQGDEIEITSSPVDGFEFVMWVGAAGWIFEPNFTYTVTDEEEQLLIAIFAEPQSQLSVLTRRCDIEGESVTLVGEVKSMLVEEAKFWFRYSPIPFALDDGGLTQVVDATKDDLGIEDEDYIVLPDGSVGMDLGYELSSPPLSVEELKRSFQDIPNWDPRAPRRHMLFYRLEGQYEIGGEVRTVVGNVRVCKLDKMSRDGTVVDWNVGSKTNLNWD